MISLCLYITIGTFTTPLLSAIWIHLQKLSFKAKRFVNNCTYFFGLKWYYIVSYRAMTSHIPLTHTNTLQATEADSWFPGFGWRIASCGCCGSHLGWLFTANPCLPPVIPGCEASHPGGQTDRQRAVSSHSMTLFEYHASNFVKSLKINYFW